MKKVVILVYPPINKSTNTMKGIPAREKPAMYP